MKSKLELLKPLKQLIQEIDTKDIQFDRKSNLDKIANYVADNLEKNNEINLNFICNYNSRRSQITQIWAKTVAEYFGIPIHTYSAGLKEARIPDIVIETLSNQGFKIVSKESTPPIYFLFYSKNCDPLILYSKHFNDPINKQSNITAIMTCKQADENCPIIPNAKIRFKLYYDDPIIYEKDENIQQHYWEASNKIASEMYYIFSSVNEKINQ